MAAELAKLHAVDGEVLDLPKLPMRKHAA
jgi:hypothetical protein